MSRLPAFLIALPFLLGGCGRLFKPSFHVDNPGDQPLALQLDGQAHSVPAHGELVLKLAPGAHSLQTERLGKVDFIVYDGARDALVNPTLSEYYLANEVYATEAASGRDFGDGDLHVQVQGVDVQGRYWQTHDLFIAKDWDFDVHTPFPDSVTSAQVRDGGRQMRKIFSAPDFAGYLEQQAGEPGYFARERPAGWQPPRYTLADVLPTLPTLAPAYEVHTAPLRKLVADYQHAAEPARQREIRKSQVDAQFAFTHATASVGRDLTRDDNARYNDFVTAVATAMAAPAAVVTH